MKVPAHLRVFQDEDIVSKRSALNNSGMKSGEQRKLSSDRQRKNKRTNLNNSNSKISDSGAPKPLNESRVSDSGVPKPLNESRVSNSEIPQNFNDSHLLTDKQVDEDLQERHTAALPKLDDQ